MKVAILGNAMTGKSCLVTRLMSMTQNGKSENIPPFKGDYIQTFGVDVCVLSDKKDVQMFCFAGHSRYRPLLDQFLLGNNFDIIFLVFDMLSLESFEQLVYWYNEAKRTNADARCVLVGTKLDEADSTVIKITDAMTQAKEWGSEFKAVSSKTGAGVKDLLDLLIK